MSLAIIIPAAGCSSRLGEAKQLVTIDSQPLLARTLHTASEALASLSITQQIFVTLGFQAEHIREQVTPFISSLKSPPCFLMNEHWEKGLGASIAYTVAHVEKGFDAVLVLLSDQWALSVNDLIRVISTWQADPHQLLASQYADGEYGVPAIFPKHYFNQLKAMTTHGAKRIIKQHKKDTQFITVENAIYDLDTPEQLQYLRSTIARHADNQPTLFGDDL